jgi:RimJ/RimL family protein N-acetyltransferase
LKAAGLKEVAETYTYARDMGAVEAAGGPLRLRLLAEVPHEQVVAVYEAAYADTADESHRESPEPFGVRLERLKAIALLAQDWSGWFVGFEGDRPVGLVFASVEAAPHGVPTNGWIVEIGVVPEARGRGLSKGLLAHGLASLAQRGVTRVFARIDVHNTPSVRLHEAAGFARQPGASWMYRKNLAT